jgi:hypothetical protein
VARLTFNGEMDLWQELHSLIMVILFHRQPAPFRRHPDGRRCYRGATWAGAIAASSQSPISFSFYEGPQWGPQPSTLPHLGIGTAFRLIEDGE